MMRLGSLCYIEDSSSSSPPTQSKVQGTIMNRDPSELFTRVKMLILNSAELIVFIYLVVKMTRAELHM
jgi:hypothetical protein